QHQPAAPDASDLPALTEDGGREPVVGAELDERAVGDGQLLVRGGLEGEAGVAGEEGLAGREIDGDRRRLSRRDSAGVQRARQVSRRGRSGCPSPDRSEERHDAADHGDPPPTTHWDRLCPKNLGLSEIENGAGGPYGWSGRHQYWASDAEE